MYASHLSATQQTKAEEGVKPWAPLKHSSFTLIYSLNKYLLSVWHRLGSVKDPEEIMVKADKVLPSVGLTFPRKRVNKLIKLFQAISGSWCRGSTYLEFIWGFRSREKRVGFETLNLLANPWKEEVKMTSSSWNLIFHFASEHLRHTEKQAVQNLHIGKDRSGSWMQGRLLHLPYPAAMVSGKKCSLQKAWCSPAAL